MHINLTSLLAGQNNGNGHKPALTANPHNDFLAMIARSMPAANKATFFTQRQPSFAQSQVNTKTGAEFLEAFRSGLLSKGKPFDQVYLDPQALPLIGNLMRHCGYSPNSIADCLQSLRASGRGGKIKISQVFTQLEQIAPPKNKHNVPILVGSEAVPYLESVLREFGLSPNAASTVLNNGRTAHGDLDLASVIKAIETVANPATRNFSGIVDLQQSQTIVADLQRLAIQVPPVKKTGFVHIEDFVSALKHLANKITQAAQAAGDTETIQLTPDVLKKLNIKMPQTGGHATTLASSDEYPRGTGKTHTDSGIPSDVQTTINRLLQQVGGEQEHSDTLTGIISDSKIKFDDPVAKQLQADRALAQQTNSDSQPPKNLQQMPDLEGQKLLDPHQIGNLKLAAETIAPSQISEKNQMEVVQVRTNIKTVDIMPDPIEQRRLDSFAAASQKNEKPSAPLPNYLIDQMGRQISRAINRGDGVIRFQLKPPEMGIVRLEMQLSDNQLSLSVAAENSSVKELLLSNIQELRETLLTQGIKIDKLDVQLNNDFNQSLANFQEGQHKGSKASSGDGGREDFVTNEESADVGVHNRASPRSDSTIELVA